MCPFCKGMLEGSPINKHEASFLRASYKIYYSLLVPIPFVGSYIGGKIYDIISSPDEWYYRFFCPKCHCGWTSIHNDCEIKIGGNKHLVTFFYGNFFVVGAVENDCYIMQTEDCGEIRSTVVIKEGEMTVKNYINGCSLHTENSFGRNEFSCGLYIGELMENIPNGWGFCFRDDGFLWFGKWQNGKRNGVGYECDFDGSNYRVGYWQNDNYII